MATTKLTNRCRVVLSLLAFMWLSGCTGAAFFAANLPSKFSDQTIYPDILFDETNDLALDVYTPSNETGSKTGLAADLPVLVFFYGGGWTEGDKRHYLFVADAFTDLGYVVVIPNYRLYPNVSFPAWQVDAAKALAWTQKNIDQYGGDADQMFVSGHSAGAHIGSLLATDDRYLTAVGGDPESIKAFAGLAGPYHFTPRQPKYVEIFAPPSNYPNMQVSTFIDGEQPPMLLLWGRDDNVVGNINLTNLEKTLQAKGGEYRIKRYADIDHTSIVSVLSKIVPDNAPVAKDMDAFFRQYIDQ